MSKCSTCPLSGSVLLAEPGAFPDAGAVSEGFDTMYLADDLSIALQIFGAKAGTFGNASQHSRPDCFTVVKGKYEV